jgi:hypothetical protein
MKDVKAIVSRCKQVRDKQDAEKGVLPYVRRRLSFVVAFVVCRAVLISMEK